MENLLRKGVKYVANYMKRNGFITVCDYEDNDNTVVEFARVCAGVTVESVVITFNSNWRVISVR